MGATQKHEAADRSEDSGVRRRPLPPPTLSTPPSSDDEPFALSALTALSTTSVMNDVAFADVVPRADPELDAIEQRIGRTSASRRTFRLVSALVAIALGATVAAVTSSRDPGEVPNADSASASAAPVAQRAASASASDTVAAERTDQAPVALPAQYVGATSASDRDARRERSERGTSADANDTNDASDVADETTEATEPTDDATASTEATTEATSGADANAPPRPHVFHPTPTRPGSALAAVDRALGVGADRTPAREVLTAAPEPVATAPLSRDEVVAAMDAVRPQVVACGGDRRGLTRIDLSVAPSGSVRLVRVTGAFAGSPEGSCMARAARAASFPSFEGDDFAIEYPIRL